MFSLMIIVGNVMQDTELLTEEKFTIALDGLIVVSQLMREPITGPGTPWLVIQVEFSQNLFFFIYNKFITL